MDKVRKQTVGVRAIERENARLIKRHGPLEVVQLGPLPSRRECREGPRPCPHARCRHHLGFDVAPNGALTENLGWQARGSCALDVAEGREGATLAEVGRVLGITTERVRQLEAVACGNLSRRLLKLGIGRAETHAYLARQRPTNTWDDIRDTFADFHVAQQRRQAVRIKGKKARASGSPRQRRFQEFCLPLLQQGMKAKDVVAQAAKAGLRMRLTDVSLARKMLGLPPGNPNWRG